MTDERLACCIWLLIRRAQSGDVCAGALLADYARLKVLAREPLDALLRHYVPTGYEQTQSSEIIREGSTAMLYANLGKAKPFIGDDCPRLGPDDGPDALEDT